VREGEEHSELVQCCKGDCKLGVKWEGNNNRCCCSNCVADVGEMGGVTVTGVAVPIVWQMHSSILHFKAAEQINNINL